MRLVLAMVLAGLAALPLTASAQEAEEGATPEPSAEDSAPSPESAPEQPALDDAGAKVTPTRDGFYILEPTSLEPDLQKPGAPWLRLELDSAGMQITPTAKRSYVPTVGLLVPGFWRMFKVDAVTVTLDMATPS